MDDLITYLMNRSPAMRAALEGKAALVMDPSRLRSNEPLPPCPPRFPNTIPNFYRPIKATRATKRQRYRCHRTHRDGYPRLRRRPNRLSTKTAFRALSSFFERAALSSPLTLSFAASTSYATRAENCGTKWKLTDRVQSLAKVFEVVAGIQVGSRRNSRGRIPPCLTRKYFSGMEARCFRSCCAE